MASRGGRDRYRRDYPSRSEEKSHHGRSSAPPSRHLWVGNLPHDIPEIAVTSHFLQFGELESVAFQPGRSYAFINFKNDEDAFAAVRALQGFVVAGNALKIEFAKADKSSTPSRGEDYLPRRDEQRSGGRGSPFSQRDSRVRHSSPEASFTDKSKMNDKNAEPSEVLWIGFPALLKVDDVILRRAFSPFGEIEKITAFPGRSYAFVRFKNVMSACRAKETLQGRLFGNPRVHICFAKSESGSSNRPPSPNFRSHGRPGSSENFRQNRSFGNFPGDPPLRSPQFIANQEPGEPEMMNFGRNENLWVGGSGGWRFQEPGSELELLENMHEHPGSPTRDRGIQFREFSPQQFPQKRPFHEDSWDYNEDVFPFPGAKKPKTGFSPPENELPEYSLSDSRQIKHAPPKRYPDFAQTESGPYGYKQFPDRAMNVTPPYGERNDQWDESNESFQAGPGLPLNPVEFKRFTPESHQPLVTEEWKWEGTIAKGGTPICRARCFPVGKKLDMILPDFLDCTARTGLDMLAKHYYQAASAFVIFFVPESDADIGYYNEFMNYLGEKQRAAVAKLDDKNTLFLVPPSDFSEKVLKVPGKLSISGLILRLEHPSSSIASIHHPRDKRDPNFMPFQGDAPYAKQTSPSRPFPPVPSFPHPGKSGTNNMYIPGNMSTEGPPTSFSDSINENNRHEYMRSNWSPNPMQNSNLGARNMASHVSNNAVEPMVQGYNPVMPRSQEPSSSSYSAGVLGGLAGSSKLSLGPEQLAQLASSLLGQQRQSGAEDFRQSSTINQPENMYRPSHIHSMQNNNNNQGSLELSKSPFSQVQQLPPPPQPQHQMMSNAHVGPSRENQMGTQMNQQVQNSGAQDDTDGDPQKRLQATLQLAAALLQQIQQGKGT